jgi:hypothetical protein
MFCQTRLTPVVQAAGIQSINLKFDDSVALPVFNSLPSQVFSLLWCGFQKNFL